MTVRPIFSILIFHAITVPFWCPRVRGIAELQGRISGDEAWRLGRKETDNTRIIRNSRPDVRTMEITYSSARSDLIIVITIVILTEIF